MARYIDVDKIDFRLPHFTDDDGDALVSLNTVKRCIAMTPSEDVVPKSEVAREIFEKIEKNLQAKKNAISIFKDGTDSFYEGEIHALDIFGRILSELKKKYTEDKND